MGSSDTVRLPDSSLAEERGAVSALLEANRDRRDKADAELRAARQELQELLLRGHAAAMQVAYMAQQAGVSRDTAHRIIREGGDTMSWKQKQDWASQIMALIPRGTYERNEYRMFVNALLMKALGRNPEGVPRSVKGVLDHATETMRTIGKKPEFQPEYDLAILDFAWPS